MSTDDMVNDRKRNRDDMTSSPELQSSKRLDLGGSQQDISVISLANLPNTPSKVKLMSPSKMFDGEKLYQLYLKLEAKVCAQEVDISNLRLSVDQKNEKIASLEEKLTKCETLCSKQGVKIDDFKRESASDFVTVKSDIQTLKDPGVNDQFIDNMKREIPALSEHVGKNELAINTLKDKLGEGGVTAAGVNGAALSPELEQVKSDIGEAREELKQLKRKSHLEGERRDQYSRRETLRITGVPFTPGENTTQIMCKIAYSIGVYISESDISVSHRNGRRDGNTPRPILVRFVRREVKHQILANRKKTVNIRSDDAGNRVRIFIDENLTSMRAKVCKRLRQDNIPHHTRDGKVFMTLEDNNVKVLDTPEDWEGLDWSESVKKEVGIIPQD